MSRDGSFAAFVADQLAGLGEVELRPMFGGHGVYHAGTIFGIVHDDRLYLKTDDDSRRVFLERGSSPFRPNDRQTLGRYWEVPPELLEDADRLVEWAGAAILASGGR